MNTDEDERVAILSVIEAETDAYLRRDYDAWERCWHDGPEIRRMHAHAGTGITIVQGPEVRDQMRRMLSNSSQWHPPETIRRENYNVVISPNMAWVSYDQIGEISPVPHELAGHYHELKILHKVEGVWKIACIVGTQMRIGHVSAPLIALDPAAHVVWMNDAAEQQLPQHPKLKQVGTRLQASDPDAHDKLMDAVRWIADIRDRHTPCIEADSVTRAVALGQDDTGLAHICWVILKDGKLLITFDDNDKLDQQLASAGEVYGLSQAQERLARLLVEGRDLRAAAKLMDISPNTAKTHLQRIYDKTGVRAQSALVRLLLNADRRGI